PIEYTRRIRTAIGRRAGVRPRRAETLREPGATDRKPEAHLPGVEGGWLFRTSFLRRPTNSLSEPSNECRETSCPKRRLTVSHTLLLSFPPRAFQQDNREGRSKHYR